MSDRPFDQHAPGSGVEPTPTPPGSPPTGGPDTGSSTTDVAKQEAASLGQDAKEGAGQVAQTAKQEAQHVAHEAKGQIQQLFAQVQGDLTGQARDQQHRAAQGLHGLADQCGEMARSTEGSSMAAGLVQQAAERVDGVAGWLEGREPADLLDDVKRYARRNPGTFLAVCGLVGLVGGRLTRGLRDDATDDRSGVAGQGDGTYGASGTGTAYQGVPAAGGYPTGTTAGGYPAGTTAAGGYATGGVATGGYAGGEPLSAEAEPQAYGTPGYGGDVDAVAEPLPTGDDLMSGQEPPTGEELLTRQDGDRL